MSVHAENMATSATQKRAPELSGRRVPLLNGALLFYLSVIAGKFYTNYMCLNTNDKKCNSNSMNSYIELEKRPILKEILTKKTTYK